MKSPYIETLTKNTVTLLAACGYTQDEDCKGTFYKKTELANFQADDKVTFTLEYRKIRLSEASYAETLGLSIYFRVFGLGESAVEIKNYGYKSLEAFISNYKEAEAFLLCCYSISTARSL